MLRTVAALFVRPDSVYKLMPCVDAWDIDRDARKWRGGCPIVAHPPCRTWSRLAAFATKALPGESNLAPLAVELARANGGVVEHPAQSRLWSHMHLPAPGTGPDRFGGWCLGITQNWWGHRAAKATVLYIVGVAPRAIPELPPLTLGNGVRVVSTRRRLGDPAYRSCISKPERELTPALLAVWLVRLARSAELLEVEA